ncbi:MAG TPA: cupin domain-containing protein [Candidatus Dormibacteraeota bacterium]|jgi:quercetin dioxygenase-like cupin family protein|nr:cupin domain-containing protein [Candidatus Dormibacteraeota bacterium]
MNPATKKQTINRKPLLTAALEQLKSTQRVEIKQIDFAPSQQTGLHNHPCPVVGYIAKGTVLFQVEGEEPRTLNAGDAFFEPPNKTMLHFDNASNTEPMTFIAFYLLGEKETELIHMLE